MNAVGSVASLEWIWRIDAQNFFRRSASGKKAMRLETIFAKEDTESSGCLGKLLGCRNWMNRGLQCGLSGNPVTTKQYKSLMGNRFFGDD